MNQVRHQKYILPAFLFFWLIWMAFVVLDGLQINIFNLPHLKFEDAGEFGDSFGGLSALMATAAAAGAWIAVSLQSTQLSEQREEGIKQEFERRFFLLLDLHNKIVESLDVRDLNQRHIVIASGKEVFAEYLRDLRKLFEDAKRPEFDTPRLTADEVKQELKKSNGIPNERIVGELWPMYYKKRQDDLGHYFRNLFLLIQFIDRADKHISKKEKYFMIRTLRAQLSQSELYFIFLNCAFGEGKEEFKSLAEEYALFNNLDFSKEELIAQFRGVFHERAYRSLTEELNAEVSTK
jgi:hypothetical protein